MHLVNDHGAVLGDVAALPDVAVVEVGENGFTLDEDVRVVEFPVASFFGLSEPYFAPIAAALVRIAGEVGGLRIPNRGCVGWRWLEVVHVGARFGVLDVV